MPIALSVVVLALLAGCGAKGPLILPEKAVPIEASPETAHETTPESAKPADSTKSDTAPVEPQTEGTSEVPVQPTKDD